MTYEMGDKTSRAVSGFKTQYNTIQYALFYVVNVLSYSVTLHTTKKYKY